MSEKRTALDDYFEYGIDLQNRRIYFGTLDTDDDANQFNFGTVQQAIRGIDKLLTISNKPIELHFASYGGDPYALLGLVDKMLESPCKFIFYGRGAVMSSTTWIMVVADERYLAENTTVLLHDGKVGLNVEKTTDVEVDVEENNRLQKLLEKIYADNSYLDSNFYKAVCRRNLFLTAHETIKLGLADAIIPYKKRGQFRSGVRKKTFSSPPTKSVMGQLVDKLFRRIKLDAPKSLTIDVKKDQTEIIEEYDNSDELLDTTKNTENKND